MWHIRKQFYASLRCILYTNYSIAVTLYIKSLYAAHNTFLKIHHIQPQSGQIRLHRPDVFSLQRESVDHE